MNEKAKVEEGWMADRPPSSRVFHYIVESMSLCGRYGFYSGELTPFKSGDPKGSEDCAACYKKAVKRFEKKGA